MYLQLYTILQEYIYGASSLTEFQDLTLTLLSTIGVIFVVALPFLVVWRVIRMVVG